MKNKWILYSPEGAESSGTETQHQAGADQSHEENETQNNVFEQDSQERESGEESSESSQKDGKESGESNSRSSQGTQDKVEGKYTKEEIAALVKGVVEGTKPAPQQKQMTQEEFDRTFNVYKVSPQHIERLFGEGVKAEEKTALLQQMLSGAVRQAVTMAQFQQNLVKQEFAQTLTPLQQYYAQQQENAYRSEFMGKYPEFKGFEPVLEEIYTAMTAKGLKFKTPAEAYEAIATKARSIIPVLKQGVGNGASNGASAKSASNGNNMPRLSGGGQGGAGGKQSSQTKTRGQSIWD